MTSVLALAAKDLRILARVRAGWFFTFVWPLVVAVLFGFVFAGQNTSSTRAALRVALVDEDASDESEQFIARMEASGQFAVARATRAEAEDAVRRGTRSAFVVIKPGFGRSTQRMFYGDPKRLELGVDPSRSAEAAMLEGLLTKLAMEDVTTFFSDRTRSREMVAGALEELGAQGDASATAGVTRFLGELDRFLAQDRIAMPGAERGSRWRSRTRRSPGSDEGHRTLSPSRSRRARCGASSGAS